MARVIQIDNLDQLRDLVEETLCQHEDLAIGEFQLTERLATQGGKERGRMFFLRGPRDVQLTAIWDIDAGQVHFYDTLGTRFTTATVLVSGRAAA